jgi:hypothetical protein
MFKEVVTCKHRRRQALVETLINLRKLSDPKCNAVDELRGSIRLQRKITLLYAQGDDSAIKLSVSRLRPPLWSSGQSS